MRRRGAAQGEAVGGILGDFVRIFLPPLFLNSARVPGNDRKWILHASWMCSTRSRAFPCSQNFRNLKNSPIIKSLRANSILCLICAIGDILTNNYC